MRTRVPTSAEEMLTAAYAALLPRVSEHARTIEKYRRGGHAGSPGTTRPSTSAA
ncbi:hypothetical protein OG539_00935 [Actinacidiphila glaucinigra]|uniref:hypothetical protein n=1 Tax=Actinacidiphila glaucinigra TaxID=235986 RepID=UPI002DD8865F|nr:hypothetical protein [Actinacidiphila glaucinigra]WSD64987.1 hypothetical protein OIE69_42015 [Actinacidiphila glaucinigra]